MTCFYRTWGKYSVVVKVRIFRNVEEQACGHAKKFLASDLTAITNVSLELEI
jgi:hypothetical protein